MGIGEFSKLISMFILSQTKSKIIKIILFFKGAVGSGS
jgi:hypothetical protein